MRTEGDKDHTHPPQAQICPSDRAVSNGAGVVADPGLSQVRGRRGRQITKTNAAESAIEDPRV